jgi:signal transduction histidine kinase
VLEVEDRGPGIPEAFQTHLFERFARWDEANQPQGTGLGLAISKRITEAHGGRISFETVPHERTCFTVELPMRKPQEDGDMDWLGAEEEGGASGVSVEC